MVRYSPVMEDVNEFLYAIETESTAPNKSWTVPIFYSMTSVLTSKLVQRLM